MSGAIPSELIAHQPADREVHVILDNVSSHKSKTVRDFLEENPQIHFHFTPTYSSWLNQVELWFSKIARDLIHRGVFISEKDLDQRIMQYIQHYNESPRPVKWKHNDPSKRIVA